MFFPRCPRRHSIEVIFPMGCTITYFPYIKEVIIMPKLTWDQVGERLYETGVDRGVLYPQGSSGTYGTGVAWNGLVSVTESPTGAEPSPQYADNIKYLNLVSAEEFG